MSIQDQIEQIKALRDKAISAYERAIASAEKHKKEAEEFSTALAVLSKIAPPEVSTERPTYAAKTFYGGGLPSAAPPNSGPIYQRILRLLKESDQIWWTANQIQDGLKAKGDLIKMTSISPNLSRLKESGDIVRDDLKVALADRASQKTEAPDELLFGDAPSEASNHTRPNQSSEAPAQGREAVPGGGT